MLRRALTPRWLLVALALVIFTGIAIQLGRWQWDRTQLILAAERASIAAPVAVEELWADPEATTLPDETLGRRVILNGEYVPGMQSLVVNRSLDDKPGAWVVTGLRLADDRVMAVVRGWVGSTTDPAIAIPEGQVAVDGVLHPDEKFYADAVTEQGSVATLSASRLGEEWGADVIPGYVMLAKQEPWAQPAPAPVPPTVQVSDVPFPFQNFFYAIQWWLFAAFGWVVYLRWLWLETRREQVQSVER